MSVLVIGLITTLLMAIFKKIPTVAELTTIVKQAIVLAIAAVASYVKVKLGYDVPADLQGWMVTTLMTAVSAFGFYNLYSSHFKGTTVVVEPSATKL